MPVIIKMSAPKGKTGPHTTAGKQALASNALTHGLRSTRTILPTESTEEYQALWGQLLHDLDPVGVLETALVDRILGHLWRAKRIDRAEVAQITLSQSPRNEEFRQAVVKASDRHPLQPPPTVEELGTPEFQETVSILQDARLIPESDTIHKYRVATDNGLDQAIKSFYRLKADRTGKQSTN